MKKLFSPFDIKNCHLTNRIVMPGLASFLIENDGSYSEKTIEHYRLRAAGGPAMIIMEAHGVAPEGIVSNHQARIYDDRFIKDLTKVAAVIKREGSIPAIQIHHAGRQVPFRVINRKPFAPSILPCPAIKGDVDPLDIKGIKKIIIQFGDAAERAVKAGFELIEVHGAHGYLINQFLSGFSNIREDEYGRDTAGRTRFACEIIREIRNRIGPYFPLSFKISAQEFVPNGLTTEESIEILKLLVKEGIDVVQVSAGNDATPEWICQPMFMKQACLVDSAAQIKASIDIPVMVVGRINDPFIADAIINEGKADLVCMGRGLLADPELPKKAQSGRFEDIRICIACNTCMQSIFRKGRIECLVNPSLGREKEMEILPSDHPRKIMVIGGGPGGLNVARIAAMRGHHVSLFEKHSTLGGQLLIASVSSHKKEMHSLTNFLISQIKKYNVDCHINVDVTIETIKDNNPDVVVIATGSTPSIPEVTGAEMPLVCTALEIFNGKKRDIKTAVIIGGGATGCEVALDLSEKGCDVTIVEQLPKVGIQMEAITRKMIKKLLTKNNVRILTEYRLSKISEDGAFVEHKDGKEIFIKGEKIVITVGNRPDNDLYDQVKKLGIEAYQIGDCVEARSAKDAIYEGAMIGKSI
jgi:2,4-dienoyl-CoA reductase-like NADH-dependent reductase (Old Yellow Enzyme family)/NADPH-dependent 2,4-dienoyl-CoA reductase/sulfur reductase-like enzyme